MDDVEFDELFNVPSVIPSNSATSTSPARRGRSLSNGGVQRQQQHLTERSDVNRGTPPAGKRNVPPGAEAFRVPGEHSGSGGGGGRGQTHSEQPHVSASREVAFDLPADISERMFDYQHDGVNWLLRRHRFGRGAVLADEMGLGKTVQVSALLGGLYRAKSIKTCIIIVPPTLLSVWTEALAMWGGLRAPLVEVLHEESRAVRQRRWMKLTYGTPCVFLTTYGILKKDCTSMSARMVDYVVLDEAHTIKEANTQVFKSAMTLSARHRIALTGTPIMNSFQDLWSIFHFVDGAALNTSHADFRTINATLLRGNETDAHVSERAEAERLLNSLCEAIKPYMLRREKKDVGQVMSRKTDCVVWISMTDSQRRQYLSTLTGDALVDRLNETAVARDDDCDDQLESGEGITFEDREEPQGEEEEDDALFESSPPQGESVAQPHSSAAVSIEPLVLLNSLMLVCNHPWLLHSGKAYRERFADAFGFGEPSNVSGAPPSPFTGGVMSLLAPRAEKESGETQNERQEAAIQEVLSGAKVRVAMTLVAHSVAEKRKVLIFSRSKRLLAIIGGMLARENIRAAKIDGDIPVEERFRVVKAFNENEGGAAKSYDVCLLTTQVGGVGLTFNAASVVILLDPSWNPSTDAQAVDRVHRIGQRSDVFVYRLVTSGTVEEKVYRNQIFKTMAARQASLCETERDTLHRYFSRLQLRSMFSVGNFDASETVTHLRALNPGMLDAELESRLLQVPHVCGVSNNGAIFTTERAAAELKEAAATEQSTENDAAKDADTQEGEAQDTEEAVHVVNAIPTPNENEISVENYDGCSDSLSAVPSASPLRKVPLPHQDVQPVPLDCTETAFVSVPTAPFRRHTSRREAVSSFETDHEVNAPAAASSRKRIRESPQQENVVVYDIDSVDGDSDQPASACNTAMRSATMLGESTINDSFRTPPRARVPSSRGAGDYSGSTRGQTSRSLARELSQGNTRSAVEAEREAAVAAMVEELELSFSQTP